MIVSLLCCSLPTNMVMLIFSVSHYSGSPLLIVCFSVVFVLFFSFSIKRIDVIQYGDSGKVFMMMVVVFFCSFRFVSYVE